MRPTQTIKLPQSGFTAHIVTFWSWGEKQEITKTIIGDATVDPTSGVVSEIKATNGVDLNRKALELAVKKLEDADGKEVPTTELFDLPEQDVEVLLAEIKNFDDALKKN